MKQVLALLLALLLLCPLAMAEELTDEPDTALILGLSDVVITTTSPQGVQKTSNMKDLYGTFILDTNGAPRLIGMIDRGQENLTFGVAELYSEGVRYTLEGAERTFLVDIPQLAAVDMEALPLILRALLPHMMTLQIPQIPTITFPKGDVAALLALVGVEATPAAAADTWTFAVPTQVVSGLIEQLDAILTAAQTHTPQLKPVTDVLSQMIEAGITFALDGTITDMGDQQTAAVEVHLADSSGVAQSPTLYLNTLTAQNSFTLAVDLPSEDTGSYTIAQLTALADPEADTFSAGLNVAGMATLSFDLKKQSGLQQAALSFDMAETGMALQVLYGTQQDRDVLTLSGSATEYGAFECTLTGQEAEENLYTGDFSLSVTRGREHLVATGAYFEYLDDYDLGGYALPAVTAPATEMTQEEIQAVTGPLVAYYEEMAS